MSLLRCAMNSGGAVVSAGLIGVAESRADTPHRFVFLLRIECP